MRLVSFGGAAQGFGAAGVRAEPEGVLRGAVVW
jgi:hypothetical protein